MKTIVAGTDFTPSSVNACQYAAFLAQKLRCKLVIFNLFQAPVLHANSGLYGISFASVKRASEKNAEEVALQLAKKYPLLKIDSLSTTGGFKQELESFVNKHQVQAVVMGLEAKSRISKFIWGSHGVEIAGKINAPAILVPERYKEYRLESVLLAVDNSDKLKSTSLKVMEQFASAAHSQVRFLHVRTPDEVISAKNTTIRLNKKNHDVESQKSRSIEEGIRFFCRDNRIDLVTVISRKHSVFYDLFKESVTKKVAFSARVPVLAIHA